MRYDNLPTWAKNLYTQTAVRARKKADEGFLSREEFASIYTPVCALTGIPFEFERESAVSRRPFAASIDRKDSSLGYSVDNCRIVCVAVNLAMNAWGEAVLFRVAANLLRANPDASKWAELAGVLPEGIKMSSVSPKRGKRYAARARLPDGKRVHVGCYSSVAEALAGQKKAQDAIDEFGFLPWECSGRSKFSSEFHRLHRRKS